MTSARLAAVAARARRDGWVAVVAAPEPALLDRLAHWLATTPDLVAASPGWAEGAAP